MEKTKHTGAKSRAEADVNKAAMSLAEKRVEHMKAAEGAVMKAGYLLSQVHERVSKGLFDIDDVIVLAAIASTVNSAGAQVAQAIKTTQVQAVDAGEKPAEPSILVG